MKHKFSRVLKEKLEQANSIGICAHVSPDGDALGSSLSLYLGLKKLGKNVTIYKNDELPSYLSFLNGINEMKELDNKIHDVFVVLDSADINRIGYAKDMFLNSKDSFVIDHHRTNEGFGKHNLVLKDYSSTCEIIFEVISDLDIEYDKNMALNTYTGLLTDTNRFMYSSVTSNTLITAAKLYETGFDKDFVIQRLFQSNTLSSLKLTSKVIEKIDLSNGEKLAFVLVNQDMLKETGSNIEEIEDKINLLRDIDTVELACLVKDLGDNKYKVSLRSKRFVDVSEIALSFSGGGHKRAAAFSYNGPYQELKKSLYERFEEIDFTK